MLAYSVCEFKYKRTIFRNDFVRSRFLLPKSKNVLNAFTLARKSFPQLSTYKCNEFKVHGS